MSITLHTYYESLEIVRERHLLMMKFGTPHRVLTTCRLNGGLRDSIRCFINHQICEPTNDHASKAGKLAMQDPEGYHRTVSEQAGFSPEEVALFSTAANMNNAGYSHQQSDDLEVVAIVTAGVETNAGCAGDPAAYCETPEGFISTGIRNNLSPGTIVTLVFVNRELTESSMVVASTVATEAKSAVLRELNVGSNYSDRIATGTGTDQIGIACQLGGFAYRDAGKHSRLGELIGKSVQEALKKALKLQNGMTPISQRKITVSLKRFGISEEMLIEGVSALLDQPHKARWENNWIGVLHDCSVSAALNALVHVWELCQMGIYPPDHAAELISNQAAVLVCSVSSQYDDYETSRSRIARHFINGPIPLAELIFQSIATGFEEKW